MSKILVSGGAGFMGSWLCSELVNRGHEVTALDNCSGGDWINLWERGLHGKVKTALIDLRYPLDIERFYEAAGHFDMLFHLAADATEGRSQFMPCFCTENNYMAYINILKEAIKYKIRKVICFSSMAVYGNQEPPFNESLPRRPEDIYGISKTAMEEATEVMSKVFGFDYTIIRPHNVYGPNQWLKSPYRNVVAIWINACMRKQPYFIYGDGEQKRAFSYIGDVTPALANCLDAKTNGNIINVGAQKPYSLNELSDIVRSYFPGIPAPKHMPLRPQEVKLAWSTVDKSVSLLDYKDTTPLRDGVCSLIAWVKKNGPVTPEYSDLELVTDATPKTWTKRLY